MSMVESQGNREYLGDSVYVEFDGLYFRLTTNNGYADDPRNQIALEPQVLENLQRYVRRIRDQIEHFTKGTEA